MQQPEGRPTVFCSRAEARVQRNRRMINISSRSARHQILLAVTLSCALLASCTAAPTTPTPIAPRIDPTAPFSLTLGASPGLGVDAGRAQITAKIQGVGGDPLANVQVAFATDAGTLSADHVITDTHGIASTTLTASQEAHVTATAGSLSSHVLVPSEPGPS